jgi:hypothetical protein
MSRLLTRLVISLAGGTLVLPACHHDSSSPAPAPHASASSAPAVSGSSPGDAALPSGSDSDEPAFPPEGSPVIPLRPIDFGIYLRTAVSPAVAADTRKKIGDLFPTATLLSEPGNVPPPTVLVAAPEIEGFALPPPEMLTRFSLDLSPAQIAQAESSKGILVFSWLLDADPTRAELRKAQQAVLDVARKNGGLIWDETTRELYSPESWTKLRVEGWQGDIPDARRHFTTHYYQEDELHRAVTLGLAKLGLPDLVIEDVAPSMAKGAVEVMDAVAQAFAEGATVGPRGRLALDLSTIQHKAARAAYLAAAAANTNATLHGNVTLALAEPEESDAENRLLEVRFDDYPGATARERLTAGIHAILGTEAAAKEPPSHRP